MVEATILRTYVRTSYVRSSERYEQSVNVITIRIKSRNTNDTFVRTVRYSTVASNLRPCGCVQLRRVELWPCRVVVCRVVVMYSCVVSSCDVSNCDVSSCGVFSCAASSC